MGPPLSGENGGGPTPEEEFQTEAMPEGIDPASEVTEAEQEPLGVLDTSQVSRGKGVEF